MTKKREIWNMCQNFQKEKRGESKNIFVSDILFLIFICSRRTGVSSGDKS
jgi:hypothetical protein